MERLGGTMNKHATPGVDEQRQERRESTIKLKSSKHHHKLVSKFSTEMGTETHLFIHLVVVICKIDYMVIGHFYRACLALLQL
jgi:hypothetical protein